MHFDYGETN